MIIACDRKCLSQQTPCNRRCMEPNNVASQNGNWTKRKHASWRANAPQSLTQCEIRDVHVCNYVCCVVLSWAEGTCEHTYDFTSWRKRRAKSYPQLREPTPTRRVTLAEFTNQTQPTKWLLERCVAIVPGWHCFRKEHVTRVAGNELIWHGISAEGRWSVISVRITNMTRHRPRRRQGITWNNIYTVQQRPISAQRLSNRVDIRAALAEPCWPTWAVGRYVICYAKSANRYQHMQLQHSLLQDILILLRNTDCTLWLFVVYWTPTWRRGRCRSMFVAVTVITFGIR